MTIVWHHSRFRLTLVLTSLALVSILCFSVPTLRLAGWALVSEDPAMPAQVIVAPEWAGNAGAIEAADLLHHGLATRVEVLLGPRAAADEELIRLGVVPAQLESWYTRLIRSLGVERVEQMTERSEGTGAESEMIANWCTQHGINKIIVVSTADHSRRVRRVLRRTVKGRGINVIVRSARYSDFDPNRWWQTRNGIRTEVVEFQKLALDVLRHPFG